MELDRFLESLKKLDSEIANTVKILENDRKKGFQEISGLTSRLGELLPKWFFFIDQTGIGTKEEILLVLRNLEEAMQEQDSVLLADALLFGLQVKVQEYGGIIEEALYEE